MSTEVEEVDAIVALLDEHKGGDLSLLDLREMNAFTDWFVIATVTSYTHAEALLRHIKEYCKESGLQMRPPKGKNLPSEYGLWLLLDMGTVVVHLMDKTARNFYNLESLWGF
jgi:ribosome-associated protein